MASAREFWSLYRDGLGALVRAYEAPRVFEAAEWTGLTARAACGACEAMGLEAWRELGRFDVVGVRWRRAGDENIWGVVYEHEQAPGCWRQELTKLWGVRADLKVLVGYHRPGERIKANVHQAVQSLKRHDAMWRARAHRSQAGFAREADLEQNDLMLHSLPSNVTANPASAHHIEGRGAWLLVFGVADRARQPWRAWQVWTLDAQGRLVNVDGAAAYRPCGAGAPEATCGE
jgi:hypothetical protein